MLTDDLSPTSPTRRSLLDRRRNVSAKKNLSTGPASTLLDSSAWIIERHQDVTYKLGPERLQFLIKLDLFLVKLPLHGRRAGASSALLQALLQFVPAAQVVSESRFKRRALSCEEVLDRLSVSPSPASVEAAPR